MTNRTPLVTHLLKSQDAFIQIDYITELWMIPERLFAIGSYQENNTTYFTLQTNMPLYKGKLFIWNDVFYSLTEFDRIDDRSTSDKTYKVQADDTGIAYDAAETTPLCTPQDKFVLYAGEIANYPEGGPIDTTIGRLVANYLFLVYPFGDKVDYLNEEFTPKKLERRLTDLILDEVISVRDVKDRYVNALTLFGQACYIVSPNITEKTLSVPDSIAVLRKKLIEENKEALAAGDASVMSDIENQLITEYKKHLEGDPSMHYLLKAKYFNVAFKKLLLTQGMTEVFGSPGKFVFIDTPMGDGWKQDNLADIFNEVRSGSYSRAIETADGGVIAKLILRVFQNTLINLVDCETTKGSTIVGTKTTLEDFLGNYVVSPNGDTLLISEDSIPQFMGKTITVRTPGYCQAPSGFCAKCFGRTFERLGQKAFAPIANDFARVQTTNALKKMHGSSHSTVDVSDLNKFVL